MVAELQVGKKEVSDRSLRDLAVITAYTARFGKGNRRYSECFANDRYYPLVNKGIPSYAGVS